jgi:PAS domain S-box-containing protein
MVLKTGLKHAPERKRNAELQHEIAERERAEEALRESKERWRTYIEQANDLIFVLDTLGKITSVNQAVCEVSGYAVEDLLDKSPLELIAPEAKASAEIAMSKILSEKENDKGEWQILTKDGHPVWLDVRGRFIHDGGRLVEIFCIARDITERKRMEQELRKSEDRYRQLVEDINDAIYAVDENGILTYVNPAAESFVGYTPSEIIGRPFSEFIYQEDLPRTAEQFQRVLSGHSETEEYRILTKSGEIRWMRVFSRPIYKEDRAIGLRGVITDITERKLAEKALQESEEWHRLLLSSIADGCWVLDTEWRYTLVNEAGARFVNMPPDQLMGRKLTELFPGVEETEFFAAYEQSMMAQTTENVVAPFTLPDGREGVFQVRVYPVPDGILCIGKDITEHVQAGQEKERLLSQIREQAHQVQQIMDTVPAGVLLLDSDTHIILANPLGEENLVTLTNAKVGDTLTHLGNRPLAELLTSPPKGLWHEVTADGRDFQVIAQPIETSPTPGGWVVVIHDVTQQIEIERRAQQQERLAAVGQLAAGIAHDFNNITSVIALYASASLQTPNLPKKIYERLETIEQQARRASSLIQQILDFSRRGVLERCPMDLRVFLKEQVKLLNRTLLEDIEINLVYKKDGCMVNADLIRL